MNNTFFFVSVIARLDRAIQSKRLDYPVEPDNDTIGTGFAMNDLGYISWTAML